MVSGDGESNGKRNQSPDGTWDCINKGKVGVRCFKISQLLCTDVRGL